MLAALAGRTVTHARQQNAVPLGDKGVTSHLLNLLLGAVWGSALLSTIFAIVVFERYVDETGRRAAPPSWFWRRTGFTALVGAAAGVTVAWIMW